MPLQPMPIADAITSNGARVVFDLHGLTATLDREYRSTLNAAKKVAVGSEVLASMPHMPVTNDLSKHFGPLRPPFPELWIEWVDHYEGNRRGTKTAAMVLDASTGTSNEVRLDTWYMADGKVHSGAFSTVVYFDDLWQAQGLALEDAQGEQYALDVEANAHQQRLLLDVWPALVAIGMMNCRNVGLDRHVVEASTRRSSNPKLRTKIPRLDFHTIILPGSSTSDCAGDGGSTTSRHKVRGHFKTFTADAPLLGKHVGTYWWGWQVRGSAANGQSVTDYRIDD